MLVDLKYMMNLAVKGDFAVPAFNVYNMETVMAAAAAAEEANAPVILQVYARLFESGEAYYLAPVILAAAGRAHVPVCFHLDHGLSRLEMARALSLGATGIMFDGSLKSYEENAACTKNAVEICGYAGIPVEGEIGHIGSVNDDAMGDFTEPEEAARFARETGVVCLAVLVGNAHGRYKKEPKLDIERIREISDATGHLPLVLHGGSGIPDDQIRLAVKAGIRKMNFGTDVCFAFLDEVHRQADNPARSIAIDLFMKKPIEAMKEFCLTKIRLLGAEGRI